MHPARTDVAQLAVRMGTRSFCYLGTPPALEGMLGYVRTVNGYICSHQTFLFSAAICHTLNRFSGFFFLANSLIKLNSLRGIAINRSFLIN